MEKWITYLLDTDTLTPLFYKNPKVAKHFKKAIDAGNKVETTIISRIEMLRGRCDFLLKASTGHDVVKSQQWLKQTEIFLSQWLIIPFDDAAATQFYILRENKKLRKVGHADLLIASIVLANQAVLVSRNLRHFKQVPNLKVVNWVD
ncbi:PIN domain-containing protein [Candidatus Parabeggiatoa sp. HSG14]|uniref:PIN domain-containing protein n=1 Tax=Candidatus Parabeggiatoa sp. HSG14 TaxID=3055593 RepID=UPI0025A6CF42|nr:PIN domain-containing protein [Thiotrichales bacterium HSG14]